MSYELNEQNAADLLSTCTEGLEGSKRTEAIEKFKSIGLEVATVLKK